MPGSELSPGEERIGELLSPYLEGVNFPDVVRAKLLASLKLYLDLLMQWNARTNLTSIQSPEEIVRRHFGESLFLAVKVSPLLEAGAAVLDFGSGAGFPGLPLQLYRPDLRVTLAESQGKKAAFLRESIRVLQLDTAVWPARVEELPASRQFRMVTLRAVDRMEPAVREAEGRLAPGGQLAVLTTAGMSAQPEGLASFRTYAIPGSAQGVLQLRDASKAQAD